MTLSDVCELIVDCPHSTAVDEGKGYPLIRTPNIGKGRLLLDGVHRVSRQVYEKRNERAVPKENDLILAREAPVGNVAIIKKGQEVCLGQRTVLISNCVCVGILNIYCRSFGSALFVFGQMKRASLQRLAPLERDSMKNLGYRYISAGNGWRSKTGGMLLPSL